MQMHTKSAYISEKHVQYVNECPLDSAAIPFTRILLTLSICLNNNCSAEKAEPFSLCGIVNGLHTKSRNEV